MTRTALVTGGAGGIGAAICRALAPSGPVVVTDLDGAGAERVAAEVGGTAIQLDVTDAAAVASLPPCDVLVNCAGWDELKPFVETDDAFTAKVLEINLVGPLRVTRTVLPGMIERGWGRVVNIASDSGRVGSSLEGVYSAAKGGLMAFTKTLAREVARHGITVNAVSPGPTDTPMLAGAAGSGPDAGKVIEAMVRAVPMRRLGTPEDVAAAVSFLASEDAGYITGQSLSVNGGLTMV